LSPQEVLDLAKQEAPSLGTATVYRTLKALVEESWLAVVEVPGESPRYELAGKGHHHHFHCRGCGRLFELEGCPENLSFLTPRGFSLEAHEVVLYGRCISCAA
jgi:Fur family ferric uptake transcriptional regulator